MQESEVLARALERAFISETGRADGSANGRVNHPNDRGGLTQFGLTLGFLRGLGVALGDLDGDGDVDIQDVLASRPDDARRLFRIAFWVPSGASDFATRLPALAMEHFDFAIVRGPANAVRALQSALTYYGEGIDVDGGYGELTHGALLRFCGRAASLAERALLSEVRRRQAIQFASIVESRRSQIDFLLGWEKRALDPGQP